MEYLAPSLIRIFERLNGLGMPCMIGGSVAAMFYGEPRATMDIDIIIDASVSAADEILRVFPTDQYYLPPADVLIEELSRESQGSFQILDRESGLKADVYIAGTDPTQALGFAATVEVEIAGYTLVIAPATYVIMVKLWFYSISEQSKHLDDIRGILRISPDEVDREAVGEYAARHGVSSDWERCCEDR